MKTHTHFQKQPKKQRGFALVICLTLMTLLVVVALGLLSLSSLSIRTTSRSEAMAIATANARLAMILAIGELQKSLGPDKAITATSGILSETAAKANLSGVWESWDYDPSTSPDYDGEKSSRFRGWLVSNPDLDAAKQPNFATSAWNGPTIELVGENTLGGSATDPQKVIAGKVPISKGGKVWGSYAWHVSDESVKARINSYRDPKPNQTLAQKRALLAGHRPDPSMIRSLDDSPLDFLPVDYSAGEYAEADDISGKITGLNQVNLLSNTAEIGRFRNDVTPYSIGLLTNVRNGGLKKDLTSAFEMGISMPANTNSVHNASNLPAPFDSGKLYESTHGISGVSDPYWSAMSSYYNIFKTITNPNNSPTFYARPSQDIVVDDLSPKTNFYPGPVIAKVEILFSFVVRNVHSTWIQDLAQVDPRLRYMGHIMYTPLVTLHNPYNVSLQFDTLEVLIRNVPVGFNFYVNGTAQNNGLTPLNEMFILDEDRSEKSFAMTIGNWPSTSSNTVSGQITMRPGQTLICGPYLDPNATFGTRNNYSFFDAFNQQTGYQVDTATGSVTVNPVKAKPGFAGRCVGYDIDFLTPQHRQSGQSTDGGQGVLGLRDDGASVRDNIQLEFGMARPGSGMNTKFEVTTKLSAKNRTFQQGGLSFHYGDQATLDAVSPQTYRHPQTGNFPPLEAYVADNDRISNHANAKTFGVFSAYARTTNGGVYETGQRTETSGAMNELKDGRLAGKPFLHNNPARPVASVDLQQSKPGAHSHELNIQPFLNLGSFEDYLEKDATNRTYYLTGNRTTSGIKSGSYLEIQTGPMQTLADFRRSNALTSSHLPNFTQPVGNSMASPLMGTGNAVETNGDLASYALLDHSVLSNHALYDGYYFSTIASQNNQNPGVTFSSFLNGTALLPNQSFEAYLPSGKSSTDALAEMYTSGRPKDETHLQAAEYQLVRGPFNVNSTNVQAWKAVLASMNNSEIMTLWAKTGGLENTPSDGTPILPMSLVNAGNATDDAPEVAKIDDSKTNEWNGYRTLTDTEVQTLAEKIVAEVRLRGPFLSMSEFVNRRIGSNSELTRAGALQAAIDQSGINDDSFTDQVSITATDVSDSDLYAYKTVEAATGNPAAGAPGWVTQGDLMRILEPSATVRSDTFVIRVCGESQNASGAITARAYAEAVIQRVPEYLEESDRPSTNVYTSTSSSEINKRFGRQLRVLSFRWLSAEEI